MPHGINLGPMGPPSGLICRALATRHSFLTEFGSPSGHKISSKVGPNKLREVSCLWLTKGVVFVDSVWREVRSTSTSLVRGKLRFSKAKRN